MAWAKAYVRTKWHLDPSSRLATTDMARNLVAVPFAGEGGGAGSSSNTMLSGHRTKWHFDPSSRLGTIDMGQKLGWLCLPLFGEEKLGPHLTQCRLGRGLPSYQVTS